MSMLARAAGRSLLRPRLPAAARAVTAAPARAAPRTRGMAGGMDVKKNPYIEEYAGLREITEETFEFTPLVWGVLAGTALLCVGVYKAVVSEFKSSTNTCVSGRTQGAEVGFMGDGGEPKLGGPVAPSA